MIRQLCTIYNCKTWYDLGLSPQRNLQAVSLAEHERVDAKVAKQEAELQALHTQLTELQARRSACACAVQCS